MNKYILFLYGLMFVAITSCENAVMDGDPTENRKENFDYLWEQVNEKYSYFDVKDVDWNEVYTEYSARLDERMNDVQFFNLLFEMLTELRDGHVNLVSSFNVSRYNISYNVQENFDWWLLKKYYLSPGSQNHYMVYEPYYVTGSLISQILQIDDKKIGYLYYSSFSSSISDYAIEYTLNRFQHTDGMIIDVRGNGGGSPLNIYQFLERFTDQQRYIFATRLKNGPGRNDFGEIEKIYCNPGGDITYTKPIVLLTNRDCYSATSFMAAASKAFPNITQIGDTTGGGAGAPHGGQMPNGWYYRFSVSRSGYPAGDTLYDFELGVPPDIYMNMDPQEEQNGIDSILERAIDFLLGG